MDDLSKLACLVLIKLLKVEPDFSPCKSLPISDTLAQSYLIQQHHVTVIISLQIQMVHIHCWSKTSTMGKEGGSTLYVGLKLLNPQNANKKPPQKTELITH